MRYGMMWYADQCTAGGTSANQERLTQLSLPSARIASLPLIAAYPQGAPNTAENRSAVWYSAPYANSTVDDVQFTKDILTDLTSFLCVDLHRIYASGKSNGGGFAAYLACREDTAGLFAAFAPVSAALYPESLAFSGIQGVDDGQGQGQEECEPGRSVPIINSHGEQDQTIPYLGRNDTAPPRGSGLYGEGTSTVNVPQWRAEWALRNGCASGQPDVSVDYYNGTTVQKWTAAQGCNAELVAYTTSYLGHSWPTTQGLDSSGAPNNTARFNFTDPAMLGFFTENWLGVEYVEKHWR